MELTLMRAERAQLSSLIGADKQRAASLGQDVGKIWGMAEIGGLVAND
jgi:hypothetical protein